MSCTENNCSDDPRDSIYVNPNHGAVANGKNLNGQITYVENRAWTYPMEPPEFKQCFPDIRWGSEQHDQLGRKLFKNKAELVHSEKFSQMFPRYAFVSKGNSGRVPHSRRRLSAFLRKHGSQMKQYEKKPKKQDLKLEEQAK